MRRAGRPLGAVSENFLAAVRERPRTVPRLAADLQLSQRAAMRTADRLRAAGYVAWGQSLPGAAGTRPVRVLMPAQAQSGADVFRALGAALYPR